jgi:hypothetical protein
MNIWRKSYRTYSIGLVIAWAIALFLIWRLRGVAHLETAALVCAGFFLGWLSATIARYVYPKQQGLLG